MLLKAAKDYHIDLSGSWMVGDSENDVRAGKMAGCKTVLLSDAVGNQGECRSLLEAVYVIKDKEKWECGFV